MHRYLEKRKILIIPNYFTKMKYAQQIKKRLNFDKVLQY